MYGEKKQNKWFQVENITKDFWLAVVRTVGPAGADMWESELTVQV